MGFFLFLGKTEDTKFALSKSLYPSYSLSKISCKLAILTMLISNVVGGQKYASSMIAWKQRTEPGCIFLNVIGWVGGTWKLYYIR